MTDNALQFKVRYDRRYPVKWDSPASAEGFLGHAEKPLVLEPREAVLAIMHAWNTGYPGGPEYGPDSPWVGWVHMQEGVLRVKSIVEDKLVPLIASCRARGIRIVHIASRETYAVRYPQYLALKQEAGAEPGAREGSPNRTWMEEIAAEAYGPKVMEHKAVKNTLIDIAPPIRPAAEDYVVATSHQFNYLLRKLGAWNILYTGFMTNCCLLFSPAGMTDMSRLGYRFVLLRDCTTGWENKESVGTMRATEEAIRIVEGNAWGYTADSADLMRAL